jgi:hypothetical protein
MTAQFHENLILDGEDTSMAYCPPLPPEGDGRVRLQEGASEDDWECTACWRGYVATWEICDDKIYLNKFSRKYVIEEGHPLFADWISETYEFRRVNSWSMYTWGLALFMSRI